MSATMNCDVASGLPLDVLAKTIVALLDKADKADNSRIAAGLHLVEARNRVKAGEAGIDVGWEAWCLQNIKRSQGDVRKCLALANALDPAEALEHEREQARERMRRVRELQRQQAVDRANVRAVPATRKTPEPPTERPLTSIISSVWTTELIAARDAFVGACAVEDGWRRDAPCDNEHSKFLGFKKDYASQSGDYTFLRFTRDQWISAGCQHSLDGSPALVHDALLDLCGMRDVVTRWRRESTLELMECGDNVPAEWDTVDVIEQWSLDHPDLVAEREAKALRESEDAAARVAARKAQRRRRRAVRAAPGPNTCGTPHGFPLPPGADSGLRDQQETTSAD